MFYNFMCDVPKNDPFFSSVAAFFCKYYPTGYKYTSYKPFVNLLFCGDPLTSFQYAIETTWKIGNENIIFDNIRASLKNDVLQIQLSNNASLHPSGWLFILGVSKLSETSTINPQIIITPNDGPPPYINTTELQETKGAFPCFLTLSSLKLENLGKISGVLAGFVYKETDYISKNPLMITGSFNNITIYTN